MSRKVALLIGVSEYGEGIPSLSAPLNDVAAMERVLENPHMGGFDEVTTRFNPDLPAMQKAVQQIFANCRKDDLVLLFFSGHGITDDNNRLYLATKGTSKDFYKATSVPASFIQDISLESYAKRQVIVLDCCYSGAFAEGWQAKSVGIDLEKELGAEGRVVLTSSTATQTSFQQEDEELSLYTQYLIEGIETGAADKEGNGKIYAHELHDYAKAKVQEVKPKQKPEIIIDKEGFNILLSQAPVNDPELDFRKLVERYATEGQITIAGNYILRVKRQELGITEQKSDEIVNEVLAPYRKRIENIKLYKQAFTEAVAQNYPLTERLLNELKDLEDVLGLEDKDIEQVKEPILAKKKAEDRRQQEVQQQEQEEYENKLQQYEQELLKAVEREYPLSKNTRNEINILQQSLGLRDEDVKQIEQPILAQAEAKYQEKLKEEQRQRQKEQEAERVKQLELRKQQEREEYENKLQQYEQEFIKAIQAGYPLNRDVRDSLKNYQGTLEITDEDITRIEQPILAQEEAKYQEKLKEEKAKKQRQQEAEKAKQLELQKQREAEKQEEKLKQQEAEHQRRLQQYEQKVANAIRQGIYPSHIRRELRQLQQTLGLKDSDVSSIETEILSTREASQPLPAKFKRKPTLEAQPQFPLDQTSSQSSPVLNSTSNHSHPAWGKKILTALTISLVVGIGYVGYKTIILEQSSEQIEQPSEQIEQSSVAVIKAAWLGLDKFNLKEDEIYDQCHTIFVDGGVRNIYCRVKPVLDYQKLKKISGLPVFIKGPHKNSLNLDANDFGYYNKHFVVWLRENINLGAKDFEFQKITQPLYDKYIRETARPFYKTHRVLFADQSHLELVKKDYLTRISNYDRSPFSDYYDSASYYFGEKFAAQAFDLYDGDEMVVKYGPPLSFTTAAGFWVRRSIDGTDREFFALLEDLLNTYDSEFIRGLNDQ